MILSLKNIGKVESAKVELNGITVIAGENDTGKSTIGKALYSIFNGFYKIESKIRDEREDNIERLLDVLYHNVTNRMTMRVDTEEIAHTINMNADKYRNNSTLLRADIIEAISLSDSNFNQKTKDIASEDLNEIFKRIEDVLSFSITVLCAFQKAKNVNDRLQKKAFAYTIFAQYQCCVVAT